MDLMQEHHSTSAVYQSASTSNTHLMEKGRCAPLSILKFEISRGDHTSVQEVVEVALNGSLQQAQDVVRTGHPFM
jgi:hypothetical protein